MYIQYNINLKSRIYLHSQPPPPQRCIMENIKCEYVFGPIQTHHIKGLILPYQQLSIIGQG